MINNINNSQSTNYTSQSHSQFQYGIANGIAIRFNSSGTHAEAYNLNAQRWEQTSNPSEYIQMVKNDGNIITLDAMKKFLIKEGADNPSFL